MFAPKSYVDSNLNAIETNVSQNSSKISALEETVSGLSSSVTQISSDVSSLQGSVSGITEEIINILYPVGIVVSVISSDSPPFMNYGTWEQVGQGRVLWGADSSHTAGTTIEAGLPNITGAINPTITTGGVRFALEESNGALYSMYNQYGNYLSNLSYAGSGASRIGLDASRSNSIYGSSTTVQPPSLVVIFYKRIA